jgi:chloramphenicol 3-O phosphotransferase
MNPPVIVLHGPTSAGKSSLGRALQEISPVPAFHVSLDSFVTMSRRCDMRSPEEIQQAYHIHCDNLRSTLTRLMSTQFEVIVDLVLRDEIELQEVFNTIQSRPVYLIGVRAPLAILEERERNRDDRGIGMAREQNSSPAFNRNYDLIIDTTKYSPEEGAIEIRSFIRDHMTRVGLDTEIQTPGSVSDSRK